MDEMLQLILDMDKAARERVREAEAYRDNEIADLSSKKDLITQDENQKALDFALKKSQRQRSANEAYLSEIAQRNQKISDEIDAAYKENSQKWINSIVEKVTKI